MSNLLDKLAAEGQLSSDQVARIGRRVVAMVKEARKNPQFLEEAKEKLSFLNPEEAMQMLRRSSAAAGIGAGLMAGGYGVHKIVEKIHDRAEALEKAKNYKEMIEANPELQDASVDARMMQRHFGTLHKFNPDYASDPMISGTYVKNSLAYPSQDINALNNIVKARSEIVRSKEGPGNSLMKPMVQAAGKMLIPKL